MIKLKKCLIYIIEHREIISGKVLSQISLFDEKLATEFLEQYIDDLNKKLDKNESHYNSRLSECTNGYDTYCIAKYTLNSKFGLNTE